MSSLGEQYPKEQARVREILGHYKKIGPAGAFGASWIGDVLKRADEAAISGDVVAMIRCYQEMQAVEE
jgi:hypothetical protein